MRLSVSMWSVVSAVKAGRIDLMGFIDLAAAQGVAGVELLDFFWSDAERELPLVMERIAAAGLEVAVYSLGNDFIQPEAGARRQELADLRRGVDIALELGVDMIRVFSGNAREGVSQEQGVEWILEGLAAGAAYAESRGVTLALENHGRLAGRSDQVRDIIKQVGSPALRVNFDTGNFLLVGQDPVEAARELAEWVALVHLKDIRFADADESGFVFERPDRSAFDRVGGWRGAGGFGGRHGCAARGWLRWLAVAGVRGGGGSGCIGCAAEFGGGAAIDGVRRKRATLIWLRTNDMTKPHISRYNSSKD